VPKIYSFMGYSSLKLRAVLTFDLTKDVLSQRARYHNISIKGNNTYQIVYTGNSSGKVDGASTP